MQVQGSHFAANIYTFKVLRYAFQALEKMCVYWQILSNFPGKSLLYVDF